MGWLPDYPSFKDYTPQTTKVVNMFKKVDLDETLKTKVLKISLPAKKDLRKWCSPIEDQETIGSCTANAAVGLVEYFERRSHGKHIDASRLFLYKVSRKMLNFKGDTGAFLRTAMGALTLFGVPPEEYWPYDIKSYEKEPPAFCYSFAKNYQAINYVRLDPSGIAKDILLKSIKDNIAKGFPCMFGFTVYNSIQQSANTGMIPYPCDGEKIDGGHAVMAVGYDDKMSIKNQMCDQATTGALIIRNSWGTEWGQCLAGDTKISLLDGREVSIEELVIQNNPVWVYSYDTKENRIVPALAIPKYSGYRDDLIRVRLDNGESILCTSDHLWLKRDGSYRSAIDLEEGDSLMPLYRTTHHGYEKFYSNKHRNTWITTHWMVVHDLDKRLLSRLHSDTCKQDGCNIIIHHKDFNPKNNTPENLEPMFLCQHISYHRAIQERGHESRLRRWRENYDNLVKISIRNIQEYNKKIAANEMKLTEKQILARRMNILKNGMQNQSPEFRSLKAMEGVKTRKERYGTDIYSKLGKLGVKNGQKISETLKKRYANGELPITAKQLEARKRNMEKLQIRLHNHKVANITIINTSLPVYDLIVARKNCHNFALTAGVFVHNSGYGFLPYKYVTDGLAEDWWTLIQQGWVDTGQFGE
jgi:C1A family cysteine protease